MGTWNMKLPNNKLPMAEYDDVVITNYTTDLTFTDSFGRNDPEMEGDIVLGPRKGTKRKKFTAKHWFGNWDKEGSEWLAEVERLKSHYGTTRPKYPFQYTMDGRLLEEENPIWTAIKNHKIVVKGYTENKDYSGASDKKFEDLKPTFNLDEFGPDEQLVKSIMEDRTKRGNTFDLPEEVEVAPKDQNTVHDANVTVTKLRKE